MVVFLVNGLSESEKPLFSCLGKVEFGVNGKRSLGSGSIIKSPNIPLIATAAHCIYDWETQSFYEQISFLPYIEGSGFRISFKPVLAAIPKVWAEQGAVEYDTGFLVLESSFETDSNYYKYAVPAVFNISRELDYLVCGFQNRLFPAKKPLLSRGIAQKDRFKNSSLQGISCKGKSGMSGGPWITKYEGIYVQNSVSSLSMKSVKNTLWGPYWGKTIEAVYQVAAGCMSADPRVLVHKY
jgi:hypothetical protein